jgi:hypothetical protein
MCRTSCLSTGYDNLGRRTSLSSSVASTADFMDNFAFDALDRETQVTQQSQTGGNAVASKLVNFRYNGDSQFATIWRYADLRNTKGEIQRGRSSLIDFWNRNWSDDFYRSGNNRTVLFESFPLACQSSCSAIAGTPFPSLSAHCSVVRRRLGVGFFFVFQILSIWNCRNAILGG